MRRSSLFWGMILVVGGLLLMLDNLNLLPVKSWDVLWPTALVFFGIWILIGSLTSRRLLEPEHLLVPLEDATEVNLRVNHGAGRLRLFSDASLEQLAEGDFVGGLDLRSRKIGERLVVEMRLPARNFSVGPWFWRQQSLDWSVGLNSQVPIRLDLRTGASETDVDLTGLQVVELRLSTGASSTRLVMPGSAGYTRAQIEAGAASVSVRIPQDVGARIQCQGGLANFSIDKARFERIGSGLYQSADFEAVVNKIDLKVQAGVGSVDIS